jgi:hypothetical protein
MAYWWLSPPGYRRVHSIRHADTNHAVLTGFSAGSVSASASSRTRCYRIFLQATIDHEWKCTLLERRLITIRNFRPFHLSGVVKQFSDTRKKRKRYLTRPPARLPPSRPGGRFIAADLLAPKDASSPVDETANPLIKSNPFDSSLYPRQGSGKKLFSIAC